MRSRGESRGTIRSFARTETLRVYYLELRCELRERESGRFRALTVNSKESHLVTHCGGSVVRGTVFLVFVQCRSDLISCPLAL